MDANIKTPQDALEWLDRSIREEAELDGEMSSAHAIQLGFIQNMLAKFPRRNCDVGTVEEQDERFAVLCPKRRWGNCMLCRTRAHLVDFLNERFPNKRTNVKECALVWAQMPYEEGGGK